MSSDPTNEWRKEFERDGVDTVRARLARGDFTGTGPARRFAEEWLREQHAAAKRLETKRFNTIRTWTVIAGFAGAVAAVAGAVAAVASVIALFK